MRIKSLDAFKAIAAYIVILLHYGVLSGFSLAVGRIAVPFFFLVSGYFLWDDEQNVVRHRCYKNIIKLIFIIVFVNLFTIGKSMIKLYVHHQSFDELLQKIFSFKFLFFNFNISSYLWFVRALLIMYVFFVLISHSNRIKCDSLLLTCCVLIAGLNLLLCKYQLVIFRHEMFDESLYEIPSKFLGNAFVSFSVGWLIKSKNVIGILKVLNAKSLVLFQGIVFVAAFVLYYIEVLMLQDNAVDMPNCDYLFTYVTAIVVFVILLINADLGGALGTIGKKYSMWIYILHMNVLSIVNIVIKLLSKMKLDVFAESGYAKSFISYLVCICIAEIILRAWEMVLSTCSKRWQIDKVNYK